jgi:hypothetical protein
MAQTQAAWLLAQADKAAVRLAPQSMEAPAAAALGAWRLEQQEARAAMVQSLTPRTAPAAAVVAARQTHH